MTTLRKVLPFVLLAALACYLFSPSLNRSPHIVYAQGTPLDCSSTFTFTGTGVQTGVSNLSKATPCVAWRITFSTTGGLTAAIQFETSPDNSSFTAVPNTICSAIVQPPCLTDGANPMPTAANGTLAARAYGAWVRV